jgi:hypothetical protein
MPIGGLPLQPAQVLRLSSCERVSDAGIRALCLGPAALSLEDLNLRDCDRLTDAAALCIGAHLRRLRALNLEHCHRIGDRSAWLPGKLHVHACALRAAACVCMHAGIIDPGDRGSPGRPAGQLALAHACAVLSLPLAVPSHCLMVLTVGLNFNGSALGGREMKITVHHGLLVCVRGAAALAELSELEVLRLGGTGATCAAAASRFRRRRVTLSTVPKHRIWWMLDA